MAFTLELQHYRIKEIDHVPKLLFWAVTKLKTSLSPSLLNKIIDKMRLFFMYQYIKLLVAVK